LWGNVLPNSDFDHNVGEYLHALEDTYAHCTGVGHRNWHYYGNITFLGFTLWVMAAFTGHGHLGHEPDHTWRDVTKGMAMLKMYIRTLWISNKCNNNIQIKLRKIGLL